MHDHQKVEKDLADKIIKVLAFHIGAEVADIALEDSFTDELHMSPSDCIDFLHALEKDQIDVSTVDFGKITTVGELIDEITSNQILT